MATSCCFCGISAELRIKVLEELSTCLQDLESAVAACSCMDRALNSAPRSIIRSVLESEASPVLSRIAIAVHATEASICVEKFDECRRIVIRGEAIPASKQPITLSDAKRFLVVWEMAKLFRLRTPVPPVKEERIILAIFHAAFFLDTMWSYRNTSMRKEEVFAIGAKWFSRSTPWAKEQLASILDGGIRYFETFIQELHQSHLNATSEEELFQTLLQYRLQTWVKEVWKSLRRMLAGNRWMVHARRVLHAEFPDHARPHWDNLNVYDMSHQMKAQMPLRVGGGAHPYLTIYSRALGCLPMDMQHRLVHSVHSGWSLGPRKDAYLQIFNTPISPAVCLECILRITNETVPWNMDLDSIVHSMGRTVDGAEEYHRVTSSRFDYEPRHPANLEFEFMEADVAALEMF